MAYSVLTEDKVLQQIHIPEHLAVDRCIFPKSEENTPSPPETSKYFHWFNRILITQICPILYSVQQNAKIPPPKRNLFLK